MARVLPQLADGGQHAVKDMAVALSLELGLTEYQLRQVLPRAIHRAALPG